MAQRRPTQSYEDHNPAGWQDGWKKREKNWWKLLSPWKQRSQVEAFGSPSIAKTYKTDLIHTWHYYHSVSVRSLLSLRPRGHPACVSKLCASSLTTKQVYAQMEPRGRDNVAKPSENTLHPSRWSDSCDLVCSINVNRLNHNLHFWDESIQTSGNINSKCAESHQTSILDVQPQHSWTIFFLVFKIMTPFPLLDRPLMQTGRANVRYNDETNNK